MSIDMSKLASGAAYGASAGTIANGLLTRLSPDEWRAGRYPGRAVHARHQLVLQAQGYPGANQSPSALAYNTRHQRGLTHGYVKQPAQ